MMGVETCVMVDRLLNMAYVQKQSGRAEKELFHVDDAAHSDLFRCRSRCEIHEFDYRSSVDPFVDTACDHTNACQKNYPEQRARGRGKHTGLNLVLIFVPLQICLDIFQVIPVILSKSNERCTVIIFGHRLTDAILQMSSS